jgi:hypothetical protein
VTFTLPPWPKSSFSALTRWREAAYFTKVMRNSLIYCIVCCTATISFVFADSEEIKKIDSRIEELKLIWRQEQDIINAYTKNKTVPVREGTKEYYACLNASNRIKAAEAEAKSLKEQRLILTEKPANIAGGNTSTGANTTEQELNNGNPTARFPIVVLKEGTGSVESKYVLDNNKKIDAIKSEEVTYSRDKNGLKIKGVFLGIPYDQAKPFLEKIASEAQQNKKSYADGKLVRTAEKDDTSWLVTYSVLNIEASYVSSLIEIKISESGLITEALFKSSVFNVGGITLEAFVKGCSDNYDVDLEPKIRVDSNEYVNTKSITYSAKLDTGHGIEIGFSSAESNQYGFTAEIGTNKLNDSLEVRLFKELSAKDIKNQFE